MRSGGPHAGPPSPAKIHENVQSPQAATVPIFRVLMRFWLPIRPSGLPYAGAVPMPDAFPHTFSADPPYNHQAPKNPTPISPRPAFPAPHIPNRPATQIPRIPHPHIPNQNPQIHVRSCTAMARKPARRDQRPVPQITHQYSHADYLRLRAARRRHVTTERKFVGSVGAGFLVKRQECWS